MAKYRKPLHLPRIDEPKQIKDLCFISSCDQHYFDLLFELIASIKITRFYQSVDFYVLDGGLTERQIVILNKLKVNVFQTELILPIHRLIYFNPSPDKLKNTGVPRHYYGILNKAFLPDIIPNYQYYFWINANNWVQDERALDSFLSLAEKQGIAHSHALQIQQEAHILKNMGTPYLSHLPKEIVDTCIDRFHGSDAVFCAHVEFFNQAKVLIQQIVKENNGVYFYYLFECIQTLIMKQWNINEYVPVKWYAHANHLEDKRGYVPAQINNESQRLYTASHLDQPTGIIRPVGKKSFHDQIMMIEATTQEPLGFVNGSTRFRIR